MNKKITSPSVCIYLADLVHTHTTVKYVVPLNIASIASYLDKEFKSDVEVLLFKCPDALIQCIENKQPDILGLSNYFWNNELNMKIGRYIAIKFPKIFIVMGGPSIRIDLEGIRTFLKQRVFLDLYILFEGEKPFHDLVYKFLQYGGSRIDSYLREIKGCASLSSNDNLVYTPPDILESLSVLPSPYLCGFLDEFLLDGFTPMFESNRGCPFSCTFCTWGISALRKVRKFPIERVFDEMEYVARFAQNRPHWVFADANFGIFPRDVEIAKRIGAIKTRNNSSLRVVVWYSKNTPERNSEISRLIGNDDMQLVAIQTWDPIVQKNIKRDNIKQEDTLKLVHEIKNVNGILARTDVLCGLPGETYASHLRTLRKAFDVGFDNIATMNTMVLPGSELENDDSRKKFDLQTKCRVCNSYGEYYGVRAVECEEVIQATASFDEIQMNNCRLLHWLIWLGWNAGFLKPLLLFLRRESQINPLDILLRIMDGDKTDFPRIKCLFEQYLKASKDEWFNNAKELQEYYYEQNNWKELLEKGVKKNNLAYTSELLLSQELRDELYDFLDSITKGMTSSPILQEILFISRQNHISPQDIFANRPIPEKEYNVAQETLSYFLASSGIVLDREITSYRIVLRPDNARIKTARSDLMKYGFITNQNLATQRTILTPYNPYHFIKLFQYEIIVTS